MESMGRKKPRRAARSRRSSRPRSWSCASAGDQSAGQVARDFDLTETAVREWVKQAGRDARARADGGLTSAERKELVELRREDTEWTGRIKQVVRSDALRGESLR